VAARIPIPSPDVISRTSPASV